MTCKRTVRRVLVDLPNRFAFVLTKDQLVSSFRFAWKAFGTTAFLRAPVLAAFQVAPITVRMDFCSFQKQQGAAAQARGDPAVHC